MKMLGSTSLTDRQIEIATLAATGLSNKMIARQLGLSPGTVKSHMHYILSRLNIPSRATLAAQWRVEAQDRDVAAKMRGGAPHATDEPYASQ